MRSRWGAALRIARRDAARHRGRSLLVVVMVGLPVLLSVGLATTWATLDITPAEDADRELGQAAAAVTTYAIGDGEQDPLAAAEETAEALGARVVRLTSSYQRFTTGARSAEPPVDGELLAVDLDDPVTEGIVGLRDGRLPRSADEAVVSAGMARAGAEPGDRVDAAGRTLRVVGVVDVAERVGPREVVVTLPGAVPAADVGGATTTLLLDRDAPVGRTEVEALAGDGSTRVLSRALLTEQGLGWSDESDADGGSAQDRALTALVVACIVIEVALLAGPAFAVGVRSQRRQLALLAAGGGAPGDLVRTVLSGALVLGGLASVAGAALGIVLTPVLTTALRGAIGVRVGPFEPAWGAAVAAAALGLLAAVLAAVVPARQAARRDLVAALGDRPDPPRPAWGWPLLGGALAVVGLLMVLASATRVVPEIVVAFGTVVLVLGAVLVVPLLVGGLGRLADHLPLSLRLAARDTARQRARSAPAIAAVMAVVAGISALAIGSASDFAQDRRDYEPQAAPGQAVVYLSQGPELDDVVDGLDAALPDHRVLPVRSVVTTDVTGGLPWSVQTPGCVPPAGSDGTDCTLTSTILSGARSGVVVATADDAEALGIALRPQDVQALGEGRALVADRAAVRDDAVTIGGGDRQAELPAAGAPLRWRGSDSEVEVAQVLVPPTAVERLDLPVTTTMAVTDPRDGPVTEAQAAAAEQAQTSAGVSPSETYVYVERGFTRSFAVPLLLLLGAGGLLVLVGTATATGLALVDARADLATLSAVGAPPATRRRVAAASALVVGLVGAVLGAGLGLVPGLAAATFLTGSSGPDPTPVYVVPWQVLGFVVVVVPVVAALCCAAAVRSRTVLVRRTS